MLLSSIISFFTFFVAIEYLIISIYGITLSKVDVFSLTHMDYIPKDGNWEMVLSYKDHPICLYIRYNSIFDCWRYKDDSVSAEELSEYFEWEKIHNGI